MNTHLGALLGLEEVAGGFGFAASGSAADRLLRREALAVGQHQQPVARRLGLVGALESAQVPILHKNK
jgi:hypothetical protein